MKIVNVEFKLTQEKISKMKADEIEEAIKTEILTNIVNTITPLLDDTAFIEMAPSEDGKLFVIKTSVMIGSASEYLTAVQSLTKSLNAALTELDVEEDESSEIITEVTQPLVALVS